MNQRFFIPNNYMMMPYYMNQIKQGGMFSRIFSSIRSVNWGSILSNANKTLNVVNQTIPLVRQAGPMFNNMKSMIRVAKVFGKETSNNRRNNINNAVIEKEKNILSNSNDSSAPNFFI